jgi:CheY-like chemotaxis protein
LSAEERRFADREMSRGLCAALQPVVGTGSTSLAVEAARNVAQLLVLAGLDRLLAVFAGHVGQPWPPELRAAVERVRRERDRCLASSSMVNFYETDRELAALASHLESIEWSEPAEATNASEIAVADARHAVIALPTALGAVRFVDERSETAANEVQLSAPVAAVLRAALDWLLGDAEGGAPLRVNADASTVEIECRQVDPEGVLPAHEVIAAVGGSMAPAPGDGAGGLVLRLPAVAERDSYLMLVQDDLHLALPWTNVLRIQLEAADDDPPGAPPLAPLKPLTGGRRGRPIVTVGLGMRRGTLSVDRLIWRLAADPCAIEEAAPRGTTSAVRTDDGEVFWVVDTTRLMRDVPLPPIPDAWRAGERREGSATPRHDAPASRGETTPGTGAEAAPSAASETARGAHVDLPAGAWHGPVKLFLLGPEDVDPIEGDPLQGPLDRAPVSVPATPSAETEPAAPSTGPAPDAERPAPDAPGERPESQGSSILIAAGGMQRPFAPGPADAPASADRPGHGRRVLIAEDSFMARIFLTRLLQAQGYNVHSVGTAEALRLALGEAWALICVDVELPDARGAELIREVAGTLDAQAEPAVLVALVRDWQDADEAARGGVHRSLLKPFSQRGVSAMLARAGLPAALRA